MAQPTKTQIENFERAHKDQFYNLAVVNKIWISLAKKVVGLPDSDPKKIAVVKYGKTILPIAAKWLTRQRKLEKDAGVAVIPIYAKSFFDPAWLPYWDKEVKKIFWTGDTFMGKNQVVEYRIGIIPLLIWGAIALIAAFTATEIVDETNTTAEEKKSLLEATAKSCKDLNLDPKNCGDLVKQTQAEASQEGGITKTIKYGIGAAFLLALVMMFNKNQNKN